MLTLLLGSLAACNDNKPPTAPESQTAWLAIENMIVAAAAPRCCERGPFTYHVSFTIHETAGIAATLSRVTATLTALSCETTTSQLSAVEVFGTNRIFASGALVSTKTASGFIHVGVLVQ